MTWQAYALIAAATGGAAAVLIKAVSANIPATTIVVFRTAIVLALTVAFAALSGERRVWAALPMRATILLGLSAAATAASWVAYVRAIQLGPVAAVASVDRLSVVFAVAFAAVWLGEALTWRLAAGVVLMVAGAILVIRP